MYIAYFLIFDEHRGFGLRVNFCFALLLVCFAYHFYHCYLIRKRVNIS